MTLFCVDQDKCSRCEFCAAVCPGMLIRMDRKTGFPAPIPKADQGCIRCGHCVVVCPHGALNHSHEPLEHCPPLADTLKISPDQAVQFLRMRRSIRTFKDRPVPQETLQTLIEIARYAPTAGNAQPIQWVAVTRKATVGHLAELTVDHMRRVIATADPSSYAPYWKAMVAAWDKGVDLILRSAPALVIAATPIATPHSMTEISLALSYLELAALSMGLGTCWAGLLHTAMCETDALAEVLPIIKTHPHHYPLMVGFPAVSYHRLPERKPPDIQWL